MSEVTLRELLELRIDALLAEVHKSERILNLRLEGMNEFRAALKDTQSSMVTREQFDQMFAQLEERIRQLENRQSYTIGAATALASLISVGISLL